MTNQPNSDAPQTASGQSQGTAGRQSGRYEKKRKLRGGQIFLIVLASLLALLVLVAAAYFILYSIGQHSLVHYDNVALDIPKTDSQILSYDNGRTVSYNGHTYQLNENITTILFLGVDRTDIAADALIGKGGQADCILLIAMDTKTGKTQLVNISRDAYADVDTYSVSGSLIGTQQMQLCLSYAYGDGKQQSCENTLKSVSQLLYGIPVNSYIALDMDGILAANEAVGGVTVKSLDQILMPDGSTLHIGDEITLHGKNCERYIRTREFDSLNANEARMNRQKQYVQAFADVVIAQSKADLTVPVKLFGLLSDYMITSLDVSEVTFLSTCFLQHGAALDFHSISSGAYEELNGSAVCYLDETDLYETLLDVFYLQLD